MKPRLIAHARYWNDIQWLDASLKHIDAWAPDVIVISEGNWDPAWDARSTDGTCEAIAAYAKGRPDVIVMENARATWR